MIAKIFKRKEGEHEISLRGFYALTSIVLIAGISIIYGVASQVMQTTFTVHWFWRLVISVAICFFTFIGLILNSLGETYKETKGGYIIVAAMVGVALGFILRFTHMNTDVFHMVTLFVLLPIMIIGVASVILPKLVSRMGYITLILIVVLILMRCIAYSITISIDPWYYICVLLVGYYVGYLLMKGRTIQRNLQNSALLATAFFLEPVLQILDELSSIDKRL